ncbi:MAG: hypothetical protein PHR35_15470 [Kiritimatiellae bacterium]|nr:hypothetical protein [Kiritimatiellia bacterium]
MTTVLGVRRAQRIRLLDDMKYEGFNVVVCEDWRRHGYDVQVSQNGIVRRKALLPWLYAPAYGRDVSDLGQIDQTVKNIITELKGQEAMNKSTGGES